MSRHVKTFKVKDRDKDKNNKLITFRIDDVKLLEMYKAIWTNIELKNIEKKKTLYQSIIIRTYGDKV